MEGKGKKVVNVASYLPNVITKELSDNEETIFVKGQKPTVTQETKPIIMKQLELSF